MNPQNDRVSAPLAIKKRVISADRPLYANVPLSAVRYRLGRDTETTIASLDYR